MSDPNYPLSGFTLGLGTLPLLSDARTRSISAENPTGEKGKGAMATEGLGASGARDLGKGWKIAPCLKLKGKETVTLADAKGPGVIQHIWITVDHTWWRQLVLRIYWDNEKTPSVETPLGDFFCQCWNDKSWVSSLPVAVNPSSGLNCYWPMPFQKRARITIENVADDEYLGFFYQITYAETSVPKNAAYFHAQFRRSNPLPYKEVHTLLDGVKGQGHYVGTYLGWQANNSLWWGEGEIKFYMDGDKEYPTICGTGTEDYFGGAWCFYKPDSNGAEYQTYTTAFLGFHQNTGAKPHQERQNMRFGMYRWHIMDPIRFAKDLRVTIQALGWRMGHCGGNRYLPLQDDICSVAFWYQSEPHAVYPEFPDRDALEII